MDAKYTPLPWVHDKYESLCGPEGQQIFVSKLGVGISLSGGAPEYEANAEFIVRAVNAHDGLVTALEFCKGWFEKHSPVSPLINGSAAEHPMLTCIKSALTKAGAL